MFEREYKSRYEYVRAIQYDGTAEMALDLVNEYRGLMEIAGMLYIADTNDIEIWENDWLLIQNGKAVSVISDEYFHLMYTSNDSMPTKGIITDVDLKEIDAANEEMGK